MPPARKPPRGFVGRGGGVGIGRRPSPKPKPITAGDYSLPPFLTYDPGIAAKIRAAERGLEDIETDTRAQRHFAGRDLAQALRDIKTTTSRSRGGLNRDYTRTVSEIDRDFGRAGETLDEREANARQKAARANQDFDTQLANIGRQFAQLGQKQGESANATGVLGGGTQAASAVARSRNKKLAEAPIHQARDRVAEDLATALRQLGTTREDLGEDRTRGLEELFEDRARGLSQLHDDRDRTRRLSRREHGREMFGLKHKLQRARREQAFTTADLIQQAIYEARANRPGAFTRTGRRKNRGRRGRR